MELFEDLEFKPITEGLGFHRNAPGNIPVGASPAPQNPVPSKTQISNFKAATATFPEMPKAKTSTTPMRPAFVPSLKPEYNFLDEDSLNETKKFAQELTQPKSNPDRTKVYEPIGRKDYTSPMLAKSSEAAKQPSFRIPVPGAPASLSALRGQSSSAVASKVSTASTLNLGQARDMTLTSSLPSSILDGVFATGVSLILLVGVLLMTKADLVGLLSNSQTDRFVQFQIGLLFMMVLQMYMLVSRTLFEQTIGEWTYETQLGTDAQKVKALYPVQVVARGILFAITGFVLIPILSELFGKDLAAHLTGLALHKKTNGAK